MKETMAPQNRVFSLVMVTVAVIFMAAWGSVLAAADSNQGDAGKVMAVRGLMSAMHPDGSIDVLGAGDRLRLGDTLVTGEHGYGWIELEDGSRMTLRPGTRFALQRRVSESQTPLFAGHLLRGGIRSARGWWARQAKGESLRLVTPVAEMHIRGTEFDARLCQGDCSGETAQEQTPAARPEALTIARVVQVQGHLAAVEPGGRARSMSLGAAVFRKDRLETGTDSFAVVAFQDDSRITLQADTVFFVEDYAYRKENPASTQSCFLRLIRGGMRMLTGAIAKSRSDRFRVATPTAVAGVRGTGFDLNLCQTPCRSSTDQSVPMVGRVLLLQGAMNAEQPGRPSRSLQKGDGILAGDILQTGPDAVAVVVFHDDSRLSLQPETRFEVSRYHYAGGREETGVFRLISGGARMLTGWLAKRTSKFTVQTATAVLGVRGTGFDLLCTGACRFDQGAGPRNRVLAGAENSGLIARVWEGVISLTNASGETLVKAGQVVRVASFRLAPVFLPQAPPILDQLPAPRPDQLSVDLESLFSGFAPYEVQPPVLILSTWEGEVILTTAGDHTLSVRAGETYRYDGGAQAPQRMTSPPVFIRQSPAPRPDRVPVDLDRLFEAVALAGSQPGLYVGVYDGDVVLSNAFGEVFIGKGEAGFTAFDPGRPVRLANQPLFLVLDPYPSPGKAGLDARYTGERLFEDFQDAGTRKETECEIR